MDLVPAIDMSVQQMRRGERSRLLVKSKYGFGSKGSEKFGIPPDSDIEYDLSLKKFEKAVESWEMTDDERIKSSEEVKKKGNDFVKVIPLYSNFICSVAQWFNSRPSLVFAPLDKMRHDNYLCLVESGEQQIKDVRRKFNRKTWKQRQLLSESGFILHIAPPPLSRDRRIKMKESIVLMLRGCMSNLVQTGHRYWRWKSWVRFPDRSIRTQCRHCSHVCSGLCCPDAKPRRWIPLLTTRESLFLYRKGITRDTKRMKKR